MPVICLLYAVPVMQVAAERAAWEASKQHGFELVTICPTFVLGPVISNRADATSILDVKVRHILAMQLKHVPAVSKIRL